MTSAVLVLNATYEPLNVVNVRRAVVLLLKEKAELLEAANHYVRSAELSVPVPLVIRLVYFVRVPRPLTVSLSRRGVLVRDNYTCQYCGATLPRPKLTIDHVLPKVRGGETVWENVVCACKSCNLRKGPLTPREAGMRLARQPHRPKYLAVMWLSSAPRRETWEKYIQAWMPS